MSDKLSWQRLYTNDRIVRVRFIQWVLLLSTPLFFYLLYSGFYDPKTLGNEELFLIVFVIAFVLLSLVGGVMFLNRYILAFEVSGKRARIILPGVMFGCRERLLDRSMFTGHRWNEGPYYNGFARMSAPGYWLVTPHRNYLLDSQCRGSEVVVAWTESDAVFAEAVAYWEAVAAFELEEREKRARREKRAQAKIQTGLKR
ncbi:hypothetical protein FE236_00285 [Mariprofundus erugo]|uniref:hypothetical protein n=1 Tax=Mariprofundus erugo TaxID=2528639 RepID=UPI0010FD0EB4|nr:hypothetical protein [Mariprofundus erugo]TLS78231.1 hypothetical protein FE236_00285 [Mariprofundus erugo]